MPLFQVFFKGQERKETMDFTCKGSLGSDWKEKLLRKRVNHCLKLLFILLVDGKASKRYFWILSFYVVYLELPCNKIWFYFDFWQIRKHELLSQASDTEIIKQDCKSLLSCKEWHLDKAHGFNFLLEPRDNTFFLLSFLFRRHMMHLVAGSIILNEHWHHSVVV